MKKDTRNLLLWGLLGFAGYSLWSIRSGKAGGLSDLPIINKFTGGSGGTMQANFGMNTGYQGAAIEEPAKGGNTEGYIKYGGPEIHPAKDDYADIELETPGVSPIETELTRLAPEPRVQGDFIPPGSDLAIM